jgi:hypothetical protein
VSTGELTNGPLHVPRGHYEAFCTNCGMAFVLVQDSPLRCTCQECWVSLGRPALECEHCRKGIPCGERCHLRNNLFCQDCAKRFGQVCETKAWSLPAAG